MARPPSREIIRIGTRGSLLALAQAGEIRQRLKKKFPRLDFRLEVIRTRGDEFQSVEDFKKTQTGVFTKAIERALLAGKIDIAVHSLKDLPTELPRGLTLGAVPKRLDPSDVLISRGRFTLQTLPKGALVGTGSPRRKRQMLLIRPDLELRDIRGNLDTRVSLVLKDKKLDAVIVARAGLVRIKKYLKYASTLSPEELLPAVGQAALGIQVRKSDKKMSRIVKTLNDPKTQREVRAERIFLQTLRGGCRVPVGIYSRLRGGTFYLKAAVFSTDGPGFVEGEETGRARNSDKMARQLASRLLKKGARKLLKEARRENF